MIDWKRNWDWRLIVEPKEISGFGMVFGYGHTKRFSEKIKDVHIDDSAWLR